MTSDGTAMFQDKPYTRVFGQHTLDRFDEFFLKGEGTKLGG